MPSLDHVIRVQQVAQDLDRGRGLGTSIAWPSHPACARAPSSTGRGVPDRDDDGGPGLRGEPACSAWLAASMSPSSAMWPKTAMPRRPRAIMWPSASIPARMDSGFAL